MNLLEDLLDEESMKLFQRAEYPFNLRILYNALKTKTDKDPSYKVFVPLVYCKLVDMVTRDKTNVILRPHKFLISNHGDVVSMASGDPVFRNKWQVKDYWVTSIHHRRKTSGVMSLHRALASSFIPVPDELCDKHPIHLQVNHLDGVKPNFALGNLEWATPSSNTKHAHATGLSRSHSGDQNNRTKPAKGRVLRGGYEGYEFVLSGRKEQMALGFLQTSINRCCLGITREHKHCAWSFATPEETATLPRVIPQDILSDLMTLPPVPKRPPR